MPRQPSIRDRLEHDTWKTHPGFARRQAGKRRPARGRSLCWQDRALLVVAALMILLLILRVEAARADGQADVFWGLEASGGARSIALDTDIAVEITGLAARVQTRQLFRNDGAGWQEAIYRFPLPPGAAVDRLRIEAGGRVIEGDIQEKADARRQYQQARAAGQMASLLEQQRPNQFETRLANIAPGEEITVEIGFLMAVDYRDGQFSLSLPLAFTPRWETARSALAAPQPLLTSGGDGRDHYLSVDVTLQSAMELARIESVYHDIDIRAEPGAYRIRLSDPGARSDREFTLQWSPEPGDLPQAFVTTWDGGDAIYAQLMLSPPLAEALAPQPREIVFVIDTSGSMEGASLRQAQEALILGLGLLSGHDRFNLVRFDSDAELLFDESQPAAQPALGHAADFIADLEAGGGTDMRPALELALGLPAQGGLLRQVVFVTDGSVGNEEELLLFVAEALGEARLFTVSIGSAPNAWFMRKAAEVGRGSHTHVGKNAEVLERITALWAHIGHPALQNVCIDWGMQAEYYPEIIPDLYAGEPLWVYGRLPREPDRVAVCGELDGYDWETSAHLSPAAGTGTVATLWARRKIESLEDGRMFGVDPGSVREAVLELALDFGLLTPYTSLVAVDRTPRRPAADELTAEQVPNLLPAGSARATGFSQTATGWPAQLALAILSLLVATGMLLYHPPSRSRAGSARQPGATMSR